LTFNLGSTRRVFAEKKKKKKKKGEKEKEKEKKGYWNVSKTTPGKLLRDDMERIWDFPSVYYRIELNRLTYDLTREEEEEADQRGQVDFTGILHYCALKDDE